jgi:hypothetical protein
VALFKPLRFAGIRILVLVEGDITELHVGLTGRNEPPIPARRGYLEVLVLDALRTRLMDPGLVAEFICEFTIAWNHLAARRNSTGLTSAHLTWSLIGARAFLRYGRQDDWPM